MPDILSVRQVADLLCCSAETIEDKARRGNIPGIKFGRSWMFPREALLGRLNVMALQNAEAEPQHGLPDATPAPRPRRGAIPIIPPFPTSGQPGSRP